MVVNEESLITFSSSVAVGSTSAGADDADALTVVVVVFWKIDNVGKIRFFGFFLGDLTGMLSFSSAEFERYLLMPRDYGARISS